MTPFEALEQAVRLTAAMLDHARACEWEQVGELDAQRQTLIRQAFAEKPGPNDAAEYRRYTEAMLRANDAIVDLAQKGRDNLANSTVEVSRGRKAAQAYAAVGG